MKKSFLVLIFFLTLTVSFLPAQASGRLTVWSFTDEVEGLINNYFRRDNSAIQINYQYTPTDEFERRLDPVLASGRGVPDVFALETTFVRKYVESGQLLDLTDIYEANKNKLLTYPVEIGTHNGRVYAMSWQACPGAMFYRRSLARKYLGTDDPAVVQTYFTDLNKFMETAEFLKQRSNGQCIAVSSRSDLYNVFLGARRNPWVVNGRLEIDPVMDRYMEMSKIIHDNRYDARIGQWSAGWFEGMRDELVDSNRRRYEVFSYFLPTWGLHYVLKTNAPNTSGDWAMIPGPASWRWGGTWIAAYKNTQNPAAAKELIRYITTDDNFLRRYALDSGDLVSNTNAINSIKDNFTERFLGGQNHYAAFADIARNVNGRLSQSTDQVIEELFAAQVDAYVRGQKNKTQALADFRSQAQRQLEISSRAVVENNSTAQEGGRLTVWSFTDEIEGLINNYFRRDNRTIQVDYSYTPTDQFERRLDPVLASGRGVPDVIALEASFVRKYVESGQLLDLTDIYQANRNKLLAYPAEIGTYNGRVYAMSWQACPGAMFYRRSLARKYFGTDDPAVVQTYFTNLNKFMETAEFLKQRSNGDCVAVSSRGDLYQVFLGARQNPWVVNGRLEIDPAMEQYMEYTKIIHEKGYDARVGQWSGGWFEGMRDELINSSTRRRYEVFSYFLPTWGLHYVLKTNTTRANGSSTAGDWAMIPGPAPYRWGGTWLGVYKNTQNPAAARELIRYLTTDDNFLRRYALDSGDMVSNLNVINSIKDSFTEPFLGGQNHYAAFAEMARTINGRLVQGTDSAIEGLFSVQVEAYIHGEKTKEQALADFRTQAQIQLGL